MAGKKSPKKLPQNRAKNRACLWFYKWYKGKELKFYFTIKGNK